MTDSEFIWADEPGLSRCVHANRVATVYQMLVPQSETGGRWTAITRVNAPTAIDAYDPSLADYSAVVYGLPAKEQAKELAETLLALLPSYPAA